MEEIFISYHDDNEAVAHRLAEDLAILGHNVSFDPSPSGGQAWWEDVLAQIRRCGIFVFALTPEELNSDVNQLELNYANDLQKPVLPVLLAGDLDTQSLPAALSSHSYVDYRKDTTRSGLQLARHLMALPPAGPLPEPLPLPPPTPLWHLRELGKEIDLETPLGYERQCVLLVKLHRALRNSTTVSEAFTLLPRLRSRSDLVKENIEEIDYMLAGQAPESSQAWNGGRQRIAAAGPKKETRFKERGLLRRYFERIAGPDSKEERPVPYKTKSAADAVGKRTTTVPFKTDVDPEPDALAEGLADKNVFVDAKTKLMWRVNDSGHRINWSRASEYASEVREAGYADWRLPTLDELESLYEAKSTSQFKVRSPVVLAHRFVWSSENDGRGSALGFDFSYGSRKTYYVDDVHLVALFVRS